AAVIHDEASADARRGEEFRQILARPPTLAAWREGLAMKTGGPLEIESSDGPKGISPAHSVDRSAGAVGQGDVDAAQVERSRQALGAVARSPGLDPLGLRQSAQHNGIGQFRLRP